MPFRREDKVWTGQSRGAVGSALGFDPLTLIPLWWPTAALEDQWSGTERTVLETPLVGLAQSRPGAASSCSHPRTVVLGLWFPSDCEHTGPCTLLTIGNRVLFWKPLAYTSTPGFLCCVFASSPATPQQILQVFPSACLRDCPGASPSPSVLWILGLLFGLPGLLSSPRLDHVTPPPQVKSFCHLESNLSPSDHAYSLLLASSSVFSSQTCWLCALWAFVGRSAPKRTSYHLLRENSLAFLL